MTRYPAYRDSGVEWLGEVPVGWVVGPLRSQFQELKERNEGLKNSDYLSLVAGRGVMPYAEKGAMGNNKPDDLEKCKIVKIGNFVINSMNFGIGAFGVSAYDGVCSPVYVVLEPFEPESLKFLRWIFDNRAFQETAQSYGNGILAHRSAIGWEELKVMAVAVPPLREQTAIAAFLDLETAKIDGLVAEQRRLIDLLREKRQAVISHAVTRGLDPTAPLKPSGIDWLGDVPAHWNVKSLKHLIQKPNGIQMGPFGGMLTDLPDVETPFKLYGQENVISGDFGRGRRWIEPERFEQLEGYRLRPGDLVMTRKGSIGNCKIFPADAQEGIADSDTIRVRSNDEIVNPDLLLVTLQEADLVRVQFDLTKRGAILSGLNTSVVENLVLPIAPLEEQVAILSFVHAETAKFDTLTATAFSAIALLQERRAALISAAVTGKIDVRGGQVLQQEPV